MFSAGKGPFWRGGGAKLGFILSLLKNKAFAAPSLPQQLRGAFRLRTPPLIKAKGVT